MPGNTSSWIGWLGDKAGGGLVSGAFSAPLSFFITLGLKSAFPGINPEAKMQDSLDRIEKAVGRIEDKLDRGLEKLNQDFTELQKHLDDEFNEVLIADFEKASAPSIEDILLYFDKLQQKEDLNKIAEKRLDVEIHINQLTHILMGGSGTPFSKGLLQLCNEKFAIEFTQNGKFNSTRLIANAMLLENRFDHLLQWLLRGVILVEYAYCKDDQPNELKQFHDAFIKNKLKPLLDSYLWWSEELILNYFHHLPFKPGDPPAEELQKLMGIVLYIFKRCDLLVFGVLSSFLGEEPPRNLLCGRVIGPQWVLKAAEKRLAGLLQLTKPVSEKSLDLFAPLETVSPAHNVSHINLTAPAASETSGSMFQVLMEHTPALIPVENSIIQVLRYRLAGFPDELVLLQDREKQPEAGSAAAKMRGIPGIEEIGYPSIWDKGFNPIAGDIPCDESFAIGELHYRAEAVLGLNIPTAFTSLIPGQCLLVEKDTPYLYSTAFTKNIQAHLTSFSQQFWKSSQLKSPAPVPERNSFDSVQKINFSIETQRKSLGVWSDLHFANGNVQEVWVAPLVRVDQKMAPANLKLELLLAWSVNCYGADIDYLFKIDLVKTGVVVDLPDFEKNRTLVDSLLHQQETHLPGRSFKDWNAFTRQDTPLITKEFTILPGEMVWLRVEGGLFWPGYKSDFDPPTHKLMTGELQFNVQDMRLSWICED